VIGIGRRTTIGCSLACANELWPVELELPVESDNPKRTTISLQIKETATSRGWPATCNKDIHKSGTLRCGTLEQFGQFVDISSARVTDDKIAETAMTPSFHIER
jgi:hypothetical protein